MVSELTRDPRREIGDLDPSGWQSRHAKPLINSVPIRSADSNLNSSDDLPDRAARRGRESSPCEGATAHKPSIATEMVIREIWENLIDAEEIGPEEDFFSLGGDSMLAVQVRVELEERFGLALPLRVLFEVRTLRGLAELVEEACGININDERELLEFE